MVSVEVNTYGSVEVFQIEGRFFIESIDYVNRVWQKTVDRQPSTIAISCKRLESIDSAAVGSLVRYLNYAMAQNIELVFLDLNRDIMRLFVTAKLHDFFTLSTSRKFCSKHQILLSA